MMNGDREERSFSWEELEELGIPGYGSKELGSERISDEIVDHNRWTVGHECIFRLKDDPIDAGWSIYYEVSATELQEGQDERDDDIVAHRVYRRQKLIDVWE